MKISINGKYLHKTEMKYYDYDNMTLIFPEHRIDVIETEPLLIIAMPDKLVIQLFLNETISKNENKPSKIKIGRKKERSYVFLDAKFQQGHVPFSKHKQVRLFFQEIKK